MRIVVMFVYVVAMLSTVVAQSITITPPSGTRFSLNLNEPGPNMTCIGYRRFGDGSLFQQQTVWSVMEQGKSIMTISTSNSTFMLSNDIIQGNNLTATSSLTVLNVTSNLDGAIVECNFPGIQGAVGGVFLFSIYRPPVLIPVMSTVTGLKNGSVTFQIGNTSSPPPYPQNTISFTIAGNGSLSSSQLQYNHPNLTVTGLTEANSGSYMLTATNRRLDLSSTVIGSSTGSFNINVQFSPVITTGPSLVAAALGQPATLVCGTNLRSNPPSSILWRNSNGVTLTTGERYVFGNGSDNVYVNISSTTTSDNGTWSCVLNNGVFAPLTLNIVLFIVEPPSQPNNVTSNYVSDNTTQLFISWQSPDDGVPLVSVFIVTASSLLDPPHRIVSVNTTSVLFTKLLPGLSYDITVVAVSAFGGITAHGPASDKVTFSTVPTAPTLMCGGLIASSGGVNVSWSVVYNGGRDITGFHIGYTLAGTDQQYQPIQASVTSSATYVIVMEQFEASRSYSFQISANNTVGISNVVMCGPVLIKEGVPVQPNQPIITFTKPGTLTMTLSTAASGAGATGSFAFIISSMPAIDMMPSTYSFPMYTDGQKVSVVINNIKEGVLYVFSVSASNAYGTSPHQSAIWYPNSTVAPPTVVPESVAGPVAGGVIGGIIFVLIILIVVVVIYLVLRQRGGTYEMDNKGNKGKGVKVEEIDVEFGEDTQPATKQEIHYAELGSFKPKEPVQAKLTVAQKAAEEDPVTYSTVQINSAPPKDHTQEASASTKTDTSTTMV